MAPDEKCSALDFSDLCGPYLNPAASTLLMKELLPMLTSPHDCVITTLIYTAFVIFSIVNT